MFEKLLCLGGLIIGTLLTYLSGVDMYHGHSDGYLLLAYTIGLLLLTMSSKDLLRNMHYNGRK